MMEINISKKKSKNPHNATCQILMDGCKLVRSTWCYICSCNEVAYYLKMRRCFDRVAMSCIVYIVNISTIAIVY
jgi:hypothetical protein